MPKTAVLAKSYNKAIATLESTCWYNRLPLAVRKPMGIVCARKQGDKKYKARDCLKRANFFNDKGKTKIAKRYFLNCVYASPYEKGVPNEIEAAAHLALHKIFLARDNYFDAYRQLEMAMFLDNSVDGSWFTAQNTIKASEQGLKLWLAAPDRKAPKEGSNTGTLGSEVGLLASEATLELSNAALTANPYPEEVVKDVKARAESIRNALNAGSK
ncbi:MAG: hypothetical protein NTX79_07125 [Candidatus Micrarchaeota archaeon]|nr:hypothetical protein [Candidatus Micrarchaeota archaeon]